MAVISLVALAGSEGGDVERGPGEVEPVLFDEVLPNPPGAWDFRLAADAAHDARDGGVQVLSRAQAFVGIAAGLGAELQVPLLDTTRDGAAWGGTMGLGLKWRVAGDARRAFAQRWHVLAEATSRIARDEGAAAWMGPGLEWALGEDTFVAASVAVGAWRSSSSTRVVVEVQHGL